MRTHFGIKQKDLGVAKYFVYTPLKVGDIKELLKEAKQLNKATKRLGDRKYFVWPISGGYLEGQLVVGYLH